MSVPAGLLGVPNENGLAAGLSSASFGITDFVLSVWRLVGYVGNFGAALESDPTEAIKNNSYTDVCHLLIFKPNYKPVCTLLGIISETEETWNAGCWVGTENWAFEIGVGSVVLFLGAPKLNNDFAVGSLLPKELDVRNVFVIDNLNFYYHLKWIMKLVFFFLLVSI